MREIKFRGKSYETGEWVIGNITLYYDEKYALIEPNNQEKHEVDWETVGQYTGLKDADGVEIYEKDIVDSESEGYPFVKNLKGVVKYIDGSFLLENLFETDGDWLFRESLERKVIGNIHDNPELLEMK